MNGNPVRLRMTIPIKFSLKWNVKNVLGKWRITTTKN
jgi:hypothetical protein